MLSTRPDWLTQRTHAHSSVFCRARTCQGPDSHAALPVFVSMCFVNPNEGHILGHRWSCTKHLVKVLMRFGEGEDVHACETDMNNGGEQSSGRKPS